MSERPMTVEQILTEKPMTVGEMRRADIDAATIIALMLKKTQQRMNLNRTMSDDVIAETARDLVADFPSLSLQDYRLIFKKAEKGEYGDHYQHINEASVYKWVNTYLDQRCDLAERRSQNEHKGSGLTDEQMGWLYEKFNNTPVGGGLMRRQPADGATQRRELRLAHPELFKDENSETAGNGQISDEN